MKNYLVTLVTAILLFIGQRVFAQVNDPKLQIFVSTGIELQDLHWSISGNTNGANPNILSELKWTKVKGTVTAADVSWKFWRRFSFVGGYSRAFTYSGLVNDIDYSGDNRTNPVYTGNFHNDKGFTDAWYLGGGYLLVNSSKFRMTPAAGYGTNRQYLYITDPSGQFPGLNSSYITSWRGPFLKINNQFTITKALKAEAIITYNQVNYRGTGNWNQREEFQHPVSYRHSASGYGLNADAFISYSLIRNVALRIGARLYNWETGNGTDLLYLNTGEVDKTQLNGVVHNGWGLLGGFSAHF